MSYYGNSNNNWNRRPISEEVDIGSGQYPPPSSDERFSTRPAQPPGFGQQQQQPGQWGVPQQPGFGRNNAYAKNYNDFLERQGIPTINPEDLQILQECGRESLYFRCLPLTAALCSGIVFAARTRPTYRPSWFHYMGAVFIGYLGGKLSYRSTCEDKLINSRSNSPFVNAIRKKRGLFVEEFAQDSLSNADSSAFESDWTTAKLQGSSEFASEDKEPSYAQSSASFRTGGPFAGNRDDFAYSDADALQDGQPAPRSGTSYDDLRLRNRSSHKNA